MLLGASYNRALQYVSRAAVAHASASSITISAPSTIAEGNLLVAFICHADTSNAQKFTTIPSGWSLASSTTSNASLTVFYKVATASEPADYTFSGASVSRSGTGVIFNFANAAFDVSSDSKSQQGTSPLTISPTPTSVTVAASGSVVFFVAASEDSNKTVSAPSGYSTYESQIGGASQGGAMWVFYKENMPAGSSGTPSTTINTTGQAYTLLVAINPA